MSDEALLNRELGQTQISIGTSLALEGAFGIYPEREESPAPILKYTRLWVNVSTMFRNLVNSLTSEEQARVTAKVIAPILASEMSILEGEVQNVVGRKLTTTFYYNDMRKLKKLLSSANVKEPTTPKQKIQQALHDQTIKSLGDYLDQVDLRYFEGKIKGDGRALMITHNPVDLLSFNRFDELTLLESHTGKLKPRSQWGSKLGVKDLTLPFNEFTLTVFGDGSTFLSPWPMKYRRVLLDLSKKNRWTPVTTLPKIRMELGTIKDPHIRDELQKAMSNRSF
jgi:hypothetical protein